MKKLVVELLDLETERVIDTLGTFDLKEDDKKTPPEVLDLVANTLEDMKHVKINFKYVDNL